MKYLILLIGIFIFNSQANAGNSIETEFDRKVMREYENRQGLRERENVSSAREAAELTSGAKVVKLYFNRYGWQWVRGTGSTQNIVWMKMSNSQICYVYIWNGNEVSKAYCK